MFHNMIYVGFLILLSGYMLFSCEGGITAPAEGTKFVFLPGSTGKLTWTFDDDISILIFRAFFFTRSGGSSERLATIVDDNDPRIRQSSLSGVEIVKPATLLLKNVNQSYDGVYHFQLFGSGPGVTIGVRVYIAEKPTATVSCSSFITLNEGDNVTCVCKGKGGNPPANVTWFKDDVQIGETRENKTLALSNVNETASGNYSCCAQSYPNLKYKDRKTIVMKVYFKPKETSITFSPKSAKLGNAVTIKCLSRGYPEPNYTLTLNGTKTLSSGRTYTISRVMWNDAGTYNCTASNTLGSDSGFNFLNVTVTEKEQPRPATSQHPTATSKASNEIKTTTKSNRSVPASSKDSSKLKWYIVVVILVSGIIIGIIISYIFLCFRRRWFNAGNSERDVQPKTTEVDPTYQELDFTKINTEDNYQSLRVNTASNDDSTYTELNKAGRNDESNYQSLT